MTVVIVCGSLVGGGAPVKGGAHVLRVKGSVVSRGIVYLHCGYGSRVGTVWCLVGGCGRVRDVCVHVLRVA